jgi:dCMP deaminase
VNPEQRIVGIGYNGFPKGCSDDELPWGRDAEDELDTKYPYVCHAEMNAILNKNSADVKNCTVSDMYAVARAEPPVPCTKIYVALFPCNECTKLIIQAGIREVIYVSDKYHDSPSTRASRRMFEMAGVRQAWPFASPPISLLQVKYRQYIPKSESILIEFGSQN